MADKNLHDIKIDELDSPKKTPLKNILTLLALLFIILVISVVITKLILNTDEGTKIENNDSKPELISAAKDTNKTADSKKDESEKDTVPLINSTITERNLTSVIKVPLSSHEPKEMRTYNVPKKNNAPEEITSIPKNNTVPKKETVVKTHTTQPKKEYIDKVITKKNTTSTPSTKNAFFRGGKEIRVSPSYYIQVAANLHTSNITRQIKKSNFNYSLVKAEHDTTLTRVLVGPFYSRNQAEKQLSNIKENISTGAFITFEK
jgi:cell division septation protein DedD